MSQITHFCGVKLVAWKSGCVKFWTNIMSVWTLSENSKNSAPFFRDLKKHRILQVLWRNIRTPTQRGPGQWIGNNLGAASGSGVCVFIFIYINCVCIQAPTRKRPGQQFGNKLGRGAGPRCLQFATNLVAAVPPPNIQDAQSEIALVFSHCQIKDLSTPLFPKKDASRKLFW